MARVDQGLLAIAVLATLTAMAFLTTGIVR